VDAKDAADTIRETAEERVEEERQRAADREAFRTRAALTIAVLAMLLAIAALGGENAAKETVHNNILASDTWAFYQAKTIRQTNVRLAREELELLLPTLPPEQQVLAGQRIDAYRATDARYESEPETGEGKTELVARAREYEAARDRALRQDPNFDYAQALFQIALVLGSVAVVAVSGRVLALALLLGAIAALLTLNGFLLLVVLPIGG
jgi:hypothetical protein